VQDLGSGGMQVFKLICMMKRKPGMSRREFRDYYETHHAPMGDVAMANARRYVRRYLQPLSELSWDKSLKDAMLNIGGKDVLGEDAAEFDVITEAWFEDRAAFEQAFLAMGRPEFLTQALADEANFLDMTKSRMFTVEERESLLKTT
jgi:EthD domain